MSDLLTGTIEVKGRLPWSSNHTFLVTITEKAHCVEAVYKPARGERPLWDFSPGLFRREVAAWRVARFLGWPNVPETVIRHDAPLGSGSLQRFVSADFSQHYFTLLEDEQHHGVLRDIATFDLLVNNADRKSGHCILGEDGRVWAIDHGLCFHEDPKLRTVIWDFAGEPLPEHAGEGIERLAGWDGAELEELIDRDEVDALIQRARSVATRGSLPAPDPDRRPYPWPLV